MNAGRNAPCHCGSGAKFKACCLPKDEAQRKPHTGEAALVVCMPTA
ncbi:MAG: SEC-C metal-binding domain-containing protein [Candidatus Baltobacteraceae bacterium]